METAEEAQENLDAISSVDDPILVLPIEYGIEAPMFFPMETQTQGVLLFLKHYSGTCGVYVYK